MISAGGAGGILDVILQRLSAYAEKMAKLKKQVKGAMTYPGITLAVAVIVVGVILVFVIPVFEKMFADMGSALPVPTQMVVSLSNFVVGHIVWMILGLIGAVFLFIKTYKSKKGRIFLDDIFLRLPVIGIFDPKGGGGKIYPHHSDHDFVRGIGILEALDIVGKTAGNKIAEFAISDVKVGISEGRSTWQIRCWRVGCFHLWSAQ